MHHFELMFCPVISTRRRKNLTGSCCLFGLHSVTCIVIYSQLQYFAWLVVWHSGRTSVCDRRTFFVLRSTCSYWVTIYVSKLSATRSANKLSARLLIFCLACSSFHSLPRVVQHQSALRSICLHFTPHPQLQCHWP